MLRWRGLDEVPSDWGRSVVTIGVFDGVHRGHQRLIGRAVELAAERRLPSVLLTFDPHPREMIRPGQHPAQLTTLARRADLVSELGVDAFLVLPFTSDVARMTADEFVHQVLVERLHAGAAIVGRNFRFGRGGNGDVAVLRELGNRFGFVGETVELLTDRSDVGITCSSTFIRSCIDGGDMRAAAEALGRPHRVEGVVVRGEQRGRDLGFPTANLSMARYTAIPADGVYAARFVHGKREHSAAVSIGTNPTFSGRQRTVEAYVLDIDEDLYGHHVALDFIDRLRGQVRFDGVPALIEQMNRDVEQVRAILGD
ncbi:MAG TPA: bifunctional riboflavin kinase/FAD synthetase [Pseudonocardia sp.]